MTNKNNVLVFLGYGSLKDEIIKSSLSNRNIYLIDAVEPGEVLSYTQSCDFGLCLIENSCLSYYYSLPNKLLEYLMARKPVLVPNFPEMEFIVRNYEIGTVINDFSNHAILSGIDDLIQLDRAKLINNIESMIKSYSWESQETELIKSYQKLINR